MTNINKLFGYMGGKARYLDVLNKHINKTNKKIYIEPFLGSGVVLLNLEKEFDKYILGEQNSSILNIFIQLSKHSDNQIMSMIEKFESKVDLTKKEDFYKFRNWWNAKLYQKNTFAEAIGLIMIITCSLNNASRFGKNGYNQSFGSTYFTDMKKKRVLNAAARLRLLNGKMVFFNDWSKCFHHKSGTAFCYLDPPYYLSKGAGIGGNKVWDEECTFTLLSNVYHKQYDVLYTDLKNKWGDTYFKHYIKLNILRKNSVNPYAHTKSINGYNEVLYSNLKILIKIIRS